MASLYDDGWRQGTILEGSLPLDAIVLDAVTQTPVRDAGTHDRWVVATQDCDLDLTEATNNDPSIELRPVFTEDPPADWGIRSARLLLTEQEFIRSTSPRPVVSAEALTALKESGAPIRQIGPHRKQAFATWLGKRYDRPAVPPKLLPLAKKIAETVKAKRNRQIGLRVRDVLVQFEHGDPVRCSLFAVLEKADDRAAVREWLSGIALEIPDDLGIVDQIEAAPASEISLELVETSYSADVTQLTWRQNEQIPQGAH
jgi:hypothetical protein